MPELRQNLATKDWVVIATERARRPDEFRKQRAAQKAAPDYAADCPFCPGNEKQTTAASYVLGAEPKWKVRVVPNKFPALVPGAAQPKAKQTLYHALPGEGIHEVIVDSPSHSKHAALLDKRQMTDLLTVYKERFNVSLQNEKISLTLLFKNHGRSAGTSLGHPHSQLIGSSVVPSHIRYRMDEAERYFEKNSACVICKMVEEEKKQGARILVDSNNFCAFILFAAASPFHMWIVPKRHTPSFGQVTEKEIEDLGTVLQALLKKINKGLDNPDYNYVIQSAPQDRGTTEAYHWYLSLMVRLSPELAGFELGSGMYVNTTIPEESAKFLNSVKA